MLSCFEGFPCSALPAYLPLLLALLQYGVRRSPCPSARLVCPSHPFSQQQGWMHLTHRPKSQYGLTDSVRRINSCFTSRITPLKAARKYTSKLQHGREVVSERIASLLLRAARGKANCKTTGGIRGGIIKELDDGARSVAGHASPLPCHASG